MIPLDVAGSSLGDRPSHAAGAWSRSNASAMASTSPGQFGIWRRDWSDERMARGMPNRSEMIRHAGHLRDAGERSSDDAARYIGSECRLLAYALENGGKAVARREIVGALMYLRLISETGIRLYWVLGDHADGGDPDAIPTADPTAIRERVLGLRKRDLDTHAEALEATAAQAGQASTTAPGLRAEARRIAEDAAPPTTEGLATNPRGLALYAAFRQSSTGIHAGAVLGRLAPTSSVEASERIDIAAFMTIGAALGLLTSLGVVK
jgi:hypothetical protein